MRNTHTPGGDSNTYLPQHGVTRPGRPLGAHGQQVLWEAELGRLFIPADLRARMSWLWSADRGVEIGPAVTVHGSPVAGQVTPYQWRDTGEDVTGLGFNGADALIASAISDPAGDISIGVLYYASPDIDSAPRYLMATRIARGIALHSRGITVTGDTTARLYFDLMPGAWNYVTVTIDRAGNISLYTQGAVQTIACPTGAIGEGNGLALCSRPDAATYFYEGATAVAWMADGVALGATDVARLEAAMTGIGRKTGDQMSVSRASAAAFFDLGGTLHYVAPDMPCVRPGHILANGARTNKVWNNCNPTTADGWVCDDASTPTQVDDSTELEAVGLHRLGDNVHKYENTSGSTRYLLANGTATGNTNPHSLSGYIRTVGGDVDLGWYDLSAGTWTKLADCAGGYDRDIVDGATPPDTDCVLAYEIPDGVTLYVHLGQLEEGPFCSSPMPNAQLAAAATRLRDTPDMPNAPPDERGRLEIDVAPVDWDETTANATHVFADRTGGVAGLLLFDKASGELRATDGTNTPAVTWFPDVATIEARWGHALAVRVADADAETAYDGALPSTGPIRLTRDALNSEPFAWMSPRLLRND